MVLIVAFVLVVVSVPLTGGRLSQLADVRLRWLAAPVGALALQLLVVSVLPAALPRAVAIALHLLTIALALAFLALNRSVRGLWLVTLGGAANAAAIGANGGVMPASPAALVTAGLDPVPHGFVNSVAVSQPRLALLGDVFAIPAHWPLANVFSIGDVVLLLGAALFLHRACRPTEPRFESWCLPAPGPAPCTDGAV